jgi:thioester reductase-like protein
MAIFLTGSTGYIGAHIVAILLERHTDRLNLLVRAKTEQEANERLWHALQLHLDFPEFRDALETRVSVFRGDLTDPHFGPGALAEYSRLVGTTESVIHCAASLNRKSEKSCLNVNLRGTLEVAQLAAARRTRTAAPLQPGLHRRRGGRPQPRSRHRRRFDRLEPLRLRSVRAHEKILRAHGARAASGRSRTVFRPSIVLGDSRRAETTQFDMVRAFVFLAGLPVLPFRSTDRIDIVPVDYVAESIVRCIKRESDARDLSSLLGHGSETFGQLTHALAEAAGKMEPLYWPGLERRFSSAVNWLSNYARRDWPQRIAAESFHAVPRVGHGLRKFAGRRGNGPRAGTVFKILLSAAAIQPRSPFLLSVSEWPGSAGCWPAKKARQPARSARGSHP